MRLAREKRRKTLPFVPLGVLLLAPLRGITRRFDLTDLSHVDPHLSRERPRAVGFAAGNALDLPLIGPEREGIDHVAADSAPVVAERRHRFDLADQAALGALPHERDAVAEFRQRQVKRLQRRDPVALVQSRFELAEADPLAFRGHSHICSAVPGLEGKRGGRE